MRLSEFRFLATAKPAQISLQAYNRSNSTNNTSHNNNYDDNKSHVKIQVNSCRYRVAGLKVAHGDETISNESTKK